jgi:hypothetical protein
MAQRFEPSCRPMLRGGLPHRDVGSAVGLVLGVTPEILGWPLLPAVSTDEQTAAHAAAGLPGARRESDTERIVVDRGVLNDSAEQLAISYLRDDVQPAALAERNAAGLYGLLRALNSREQRPDAVKGQVYGPISLSLLLTDVDDRPLADDTAARETLLQFTALRIEWQTRLLQGYADHELIVVEEPFLHALSNPLSPLDWDDADELLTRVFSERRTLLGLGTRGDCAWETVLRWPIDLLCFDALDGRSTLLTHHDAMGRYLRRGGLLGWGVVPGDAAALQTFDPVRTADLTAQAIERLAAESGAAAADVRRQSLITNAGSLAMLTVEAAERALAGCAAVSRRLADGATVEQTV